MAETFDPARYVPAAAAAVGLPLAADDLQDVIDAFVVLARVAAPVMALAIPEELIAAPVFVPDEGTRR